MLHDLHLVLLSELFLLSASRESSRGRRYLVVVYCVVLVPIEAIVWLLVLLKKNLEQAEPQLVILRLVIEAVREDLVNEWQQ